MDWFLVGAAAVGFGLLAFSGFLALATGWLLPWLRGRVARPDLWGYGAVSLALSLAMAMSFKMVTGHSTIVLDALFVVTIALAILGGLLQRRSMRLPADQ
ncbi:hypothetical protein ACWEQ7_14535 [Streptomyces sp. NPDC004069]|uniref:hypothetical protein n=1 Tax=Streptomyces sp. NPDC052043 TaxID=3365684 RepID=UPI0037D5B24E